MFDSLTHKPNTVPASQKLFQSGSQWVYEKTPKDRAIYRGLMAGSVVLLLATGWSLSNLVMQRNKISK
eukprot:m.12527 g.12527  ORF g.12527 m.12527 type:complete len:68 (-) comp17547_c0_seq1:101-304(-)